MNRDESVETPPAAAKRIALSSREIVEIRRAAGKLCTSRTEAAAQGFLDVAKSVQGKMAAPKKAKAEK